MKTYSSFVTYPAFAALLSLVLTSLCIKILPYFRFVDNPGGRHIHKKTVPRGGGIAVIIAFFIASLTFAISPNATNNVSPILLNLLGPTLVLAVVGLLDDRFQLSAKVKLAGQLLTACIVWSMGIQINACFGFQLPEFISLIITIIWVIGIINAFNLIDGLDGVASGLAIVSACSLALWFSFRGSFGIAVLLIILAGSCLGFLRYNFTPARIFLGDTGSMFLGLVFAIIGIKSLDKAATFTSILIPFLAVGVPVFDVFLAFWRRIVRKLYSPRSSRGIMDGDKDHLHHRLFNRNNNQSQTAFIMYLFGCSFAVAVLLLIIVKEQAIAIVYVILLIAITIAIRRLAVVELLYSAQLIRKGIRRPRKSLLIFILHPFIDFSIICLSYLISFRLLCGTNSFSLFICAFAPLAVVLCGSGIYRIYWLRANIKDYRFLAETILIGSIFSIITVYFAIGGFQKGCHHNNSLIYAGASLFFLANLTLIGGERFFLRYAESFMMRALLLQRTPVTKLPTVVIYGGGLNCRLFLGSMFCNFDKRLSRVIGIIDDEEALIGLMVYGYKVLGCIDQIEEIFAKHNFDKIVVTPNVVDEVKLKKLIQFCDSKNISVTRINFEEKILSS